MQYWGYTIKDELRRKNYWGCRSKDALRGMHFSLVRYTIKDVKKMCLTHWTSEERNWDGIWRFTTSHCTLGEKGGDWRRGGSFTLHLRRKSWGWGGVTLHLKNAFSTIYKLVRALSSTIWKLKINLQTWTETFIGSQWMETNEWCYMYDVSNKKINEWCYRYLIWKLTNYVTCV